MEYSFHFQTKLHINSSVHDAPEKTKWRMTKYNKHYLINLSFIYNSIHNMFLFILFCVNIAHP